MADPTGAFPTGPIPTTTVQDVVGRMPAEKMFAWLVRLVMMLGLAYISLLTFQFKQQYELLDKRVAALESQIGVIQIFAKTITTVENNEDRIAKLESTAKVNDHQLNELSNRLDKFEAKLDTMLERLPPKR